VGCQQLAFCRAVRSVQRAAIYRLDEAFYVTSEDRTIDGIYIIGTASRVPIEADDDMLGLAVVSALDGSRDGVPTPGRDAPVGESLVLLSPCKTWRSFAKRATLVAVSRDGDDLQLERWRHMPGRSDAFAPQPGTLPQLVRASTPTAIGALVRHLAEPVDRS
jgi:hypothetical protein